VQTTRSPNFATEKKAPPLGDELLSKSPGKVTPSAKSAAESAAFSPDLALVVERWPRLTADAKAAILGIVRGSDRP
jgi:hypothetical protein